MLDKNLKNSFTIRINAAPEAVWSALTAPEKIAVYLYGTHTVTDWKVGSPIAFTGEYQGHQYNDKGIVLENKPLEFLSYSYWTGFSGLEDLAENYSTVSYTIKKINETAVDFTWAQVGFVNEKMCAHNKQSLPDFVGQIKKLVEGE